MILSLRSKNMNSKIKEINVLLTFYKCSIYEPLVTRHTSKRYSISCQTRTSISGSMVFKLSESSDHPLTLEEEERRPSFLHIPRERSHTALGLEI